VQAAIGSECIPGTRREDVERRIHRDPTRCKIENLENLKRH
jgi:hypothetical protein